MEREFRTQEEVGAELRRLRVEKGSNQADVAALLGIDQAGVSRIEAGQRALTARELMLLTEAYEVSSDSILCHEEPLVMLRAGESDSDAVKASLHEFRECIEDYLGVESLGVR